MSLFASLMGILMTIAAFSLLLTMLRLLRGPSIPDRAMAFDMIMHHVVALIAIYTIMVDQPTLLDAILIVAVLGFLGTVALARYIEAGRN